jgi:hypothetical protein
MHLPKIPSSSLFEKQFDIFHVNDLAAPIPDDVREAAKNIERCFTTMVDHLRQPQNVPLPRIYNLMSLFWYLVGSGITPTALGPVESMYFYCEVKGDEKIATILCPKNWPQMVAEDVIMQTGALIFTASHAQDYYHMKYLDVEEYQQRTNKDPLFVRALAYEAEFLCWLKGDRDWIPNEYQKKVIEFFPKGYDSLDPVLKYEPLARPGDNIA